MVWPMVAASVASSLLSSSKKDNSWKASATSAGRNKAAVYMSRSRALAALPAKSRAIMDATIQADVQNQSDEAKALSEATVQAAASGSAGANVDQTTQSIETNAARVKANIDKKRRAGLLQVNQDYEDIWNEAESQQYKVTATGGSNGGRNLASAALAGVGAYYGNVGG